MFCKYCGKEIGDSDAFCSGCGKPTSEPIQKEPVVPSMQTVSSVAPDTPKKKKKLKGPLGCLIGAVVIILLFGSCTAFLFSGSDTEGANDSASSTQPNNKQNVETIIYEKDGIVLAATGFKSIAGNTVITVLAENNSEHDASFWCSTFIADNLMIDTLMSLDVMAGTKAEGEIYLGGIGTASLVESYDASVSFPDSSKETESISFEIKNEEGYAQELDRSGEILYQDNGITVISKLKAESSNDTIPILVINESDRDVCMMTNSVAANGYTMEEWKYYVAVCSGTARFYDITLIDKTEEPISTAQFSIDFMEHGSTEVLFGTGTLNATAQ